VPRLAKVMDSDALIYKDKHSDERSWQRCRPEVQLLLTEVGLVKHQKLPEEHLTWRTWRITCCSCTQATCQ
jgi:hypothetical protein